MRPPKADNHHFGGHAPVADNYDRLGYPPGAITREARYTRYVFTATAYDQLPAAGIGRLGAKPGQRNLLLRVVLRDLEKTLTSEDANFLRDRIYRALHQGTEYQWAQ